MTSATNQLRMSMLERNYQQLFNTKDACAASLKETTELNKNILPEGPEQICSGNILSDEKSLDYDEYMRYCEENAVSQYNVNPGLTVVQTLVDTSTQVQSIRPLNIGKALSAYNTAEHIPLEASVESEA